MATPYPAIDGCKRLDICKNARDCPVYRELGKTIAERTGIQGEDTTEGINDHDVAMKMFRDPESPHSTVYISVYKWNGGKKGCYVDVRTDEESPELHKELMAIHQERRMKLATEEPDGQAR